MNCFYSFIVFLILFIILINLKLNDNNKNINIALIVVIVFVFVFSLFYNKTENLDNTEKTEETEETKESEETSEQPKKDIKFYSEDEDIIKSLFNEENIIIDNLTIETIKSPELMNVLYPVGSVVLLHDDKTPKDLKFPGEWEKLEGGRFLTTPGNIMVYKSSATVKDTKMSTVKDITYPRYVYESSKKTYKFKNMEKSNKDGEIGEYAVKLVGNNILNHKHPVWVDFCRNSRGKDGSQNAFALMGGSDSNDESCYDKGSGCHREVYPSRKTYIYENGKKKEQTIGTVKPHNNVPRYVLVYAYRRIK